MYICNYVKCSLSLVFARMCHFEREVDKKYTEVACIDSVPTMYNIICTCICRFDPVMYNMLENQQSKALGRNDSRLQSEYKTNRTYLKCHETVMYYTCILYLQAYVVSQFFGSLPKAIILVKTTGTQAP